MFAGVPGQVVEQVGSGTDAMDLRAAIALRDRLDAQIASAVAAFDSAELWDVEAAISMKDWLVRTARQAATDASWELRVARRIVPCPAAFSSWVEGRLSSGQVRVIASAVTQRRLPLWLEQAPELVPSLEPLSVPETELVMARWASAADDALDGADESEAAPSRLWSSTTFGQRRVLHGDLDPLDGELVDRAIELASRPDDRDEERTPAQRRAEALVDVCRHYLDHTSRAPRHRRDPHLMPSMSLDDLREHGAAITADGTIIPGPAAAALACSSVVHRVIRSGSEVLDVGRSTYAVPDPLYRAVRERDRHCRYPGCRRPAKHCHAHHLHLWWFGGTTEIGNLALLCSRHHHRLHRPGWSAKLLPDASVEITTPSGVVLRSPPPRDGRLL